jgi:hypothetical protein
VPSAEGCLFCSSGGEAFTQKCLAFDDLKISVGVSQELLIQRSSLLEIDQEGFLQNSEVMSLSKSRRLEILQLNCALTTKQSLLIRENSYFNILYSVSQLCQLMKLMSI